jgi:hypothetical protein
MNFTPNKRDTIIGKDVERTCSGSYCKREIIKSSAFPDFISSREDNKSDILESSNDNFPFVVDWQMFELVVEHLSEVSYVEM